MLMKLVQITLTLRKGLIDYITFLNWNSVLRQGLVAYCSLLLFLLYRINREIFIYICYHKHTWFLLFFLISLLSHNIIDVILAGEILPHP